MGSGLYTLRLESLEPKAWIRILFEPIIQAASFAGGINNNVEVIALILIVIATAIIVWRGLNQPIGQRLICVAADTPLVLSLLVQTWVGLFYLSSFAPSHKLVHTTGSDQSPLIADLHTHTNRSSGFLSPKNVVRWHIERGFNVVAITDTNRIDGALEAQTYVKRNNLPCMILIGEEYRGQAHLILLGITRPYHPRDYNVESVIKAVHNEGGVVIAAHVWDERMSYHELADLGVDGFEVGNGRERTSDHPKLLQFCKDRGLSGIGVTDFKFGSDFFCWTAVHTSHFEEQSILTALQNGQTEPIDVPKSFRFNQNVTPPVLGWLVWIGFFIVWQRRRHLKQKAQMIPTPKSTDQPPRPRLILISITCLIIGLVLTIFSLDWSLKHLFFIPLPALGVYWLLADCMMIWARLSKNIG